MAWQDKTLADVYRLLMALEQHGGDEFINGLIARIELPIDFPHPRITIDSLFKLLVQTNGSTALPEEIVAQLNAPEPTYTYIPPDNANRLTVTSNGRTGAQFVSDLERQKFDVGSQAQEILMNSEFVPINGTVYNLVVINGDEFDDNERTTEKICLTVAAERGYRQPSMEVAPLLRARYSKQDFERMGFEKLVVMHSPFVINSTPLLLTVCSEHGELYAYNGEPNRRWSRKTGFVFLAP